MTPEQSVLLSKAHDSVRAAKLLSDAGLYDFTTPADCQNRPPRGQELAPAGWRGIQALAGEQMEPTRSKIELQTVPIKSVDPKDQSNAKAKVVKICDTRIKLFEGESSNVEASKAHPWHLHDR